MPSPAATSTTRRLLWHGDRAPCPRIEAVVDGSPCGSLPWTATGSLWRAEVSLDTLPAGTLCVPSLILGNDAVRRYRMRLTWANGEAADLVAVGVGAGPESITSWPQGKHGRVGQGGSIADAGIDCVEAVDPLLDCRLTVEVEAPTRPQQLHLAVSLRQRLLRQVEPRSDRVTSDLLVPAYSQMTCDGAIARQICSPVSVAMVLASLGIERDPEAFARDSFHPQHRMFGVWPASLAAAWRAGASGVVRSFDDADEAADLLAAGYPIVASIRFEAGQLDDAPLPRSSGHLVVLRGLGAERVMVNDPAAADPSSVVQHYDRHAFLRAWLEDRGVGYILWPRPSLEEPRQP